MDTFAFTNKSICQKDMFGASDKPSEFKVGDTVMVLFAIGVAVHGTIVAIPNSEHWIIEPHNKYEYGELLLAKNFMWMSLIREGR